MKTSWVHLWADFPRGITCCTLYFIACPLCWNSESWSSSFFSLPAQYAGFWHLGSLVYHLVFWSKNWWHHDSYQWKFQTDPFPSGNMSILCVHVGRKGNKGREGALNTEHTGSWLTAVADPCLYLQRRLQQIFYWLVVYLHFFILLNILDLHLESMPSWLPVKYCTSPAFVSSHCQASCIGYHSAEWVQYLWPARLQGCHLGSVLTKKLLTGQIPGEKMAWMILALRKLG